MEMKQKIRKLTNEQYDLLKKIALVVIPAADVFILTVGKIWDLPYCTEIAATLSAVGVLIASILGVSTKNYRDSFEQVLIDHGYGLLKEIEMPEGIGGTFTPRLSAPTASNKNWIWYKKGGYNECILIKGNSCLPNCVGYAWGRMRELITRAPKLSKGNAEDWYHYGDGYKRGQEPKLGAVACWRKGKEGYGGDGAGHVAIVEDISPDGTVTFSNSAYGGTRFYLHKMKKGKYNLGDRYVFQGFIYCPEDFDAEPEKPKKEDTSKDEPKKKTTYKVVCKDGMIVRNKPSTKGKKIGTLAYGKKFTSSKKDGNWAYYDKLKGWVCIKSAEEKYLSKG